MQQIVLPTAYFPPIPWMVAALRSEEVIIDIHENYIKQTCRNRCTILTANGLMHMVIPVRKYRNHTPVHEIQVDYSSEWQRVHSHAIRSAYGKSAFFEFYGEKILSIYNTQPASLIQWNSEALRIVLSLLKSDPKISISETYTSYPEANDLRNHKFQVEPTAAPAYAQVFMERHGFYAGLSILDLLFCCGPESRNLLTSTL